MQGGRSHHSTITGRYIRGEPAADGGSGTRVNAGSSGRSVRALTTRKCAALLYGALSAERSYCSTYQGGEIEERQVGIARPAWVNKRGDTLLDGSVAPSLSVGGEAEATAGNADGVRVDHRSGLAKRQHTDGISDVRADSGQREKRLAITRNVSSEALN